MRATPMLLLLIAGCFPMEKKQNPLSSMWGSDSKLPVDAPPAETETAARVDALGRRILAANQSIGFRPVFMAIGTQKETVFHQGHEQLYISAGLVKRCKTEGELAAVLCLELGRMASEKEAVAMRDRIQEEERAPITTPVSRDVAGGSLTPDQTELAERNKLERMSPRRRGSNPMPPADPHMLARGYLTRAGFQADDLIKVGSLLRQAEMNPEYEKQLGNANASGLGIPAQQPKR